MPRGYGGDEYTDLEVAHLLAALHGGQTASNKKPAVSPPRKSGGRSTKGYDDDGKGDNKQHQGEE